VMASLFGWIWCEGDRNCKVSEYFLRTEGCVGGARDGCVNRVVMMGILDIIF
jgi:hypothetical protein